MGGTGRGIEIERKFRLREAPPEPQLAARRSDRWRVEQVYLTRDEGDGYRRVRRIEHADEAVEWILTRKGSLDPETNGRPEREESLDEGSYDALLAEADPDLLPVRKIRHVVPHGAQTLEVDVFEGRLAGLVVVEVELTTRDEAVELPAWLGEWYEVTEDRRYLNATLARRDARVPEWRDGVPPEAA